MELSLRDLDGRLAQTSCTNVQDVCTVFLRRNGARNAGPPHAEPLEGAAAMKNRNVLISGAGIAGPSLAYWLHRHGFRATVVERSRSLRDSGGAVDFRGEQMKILTAMG